MEGELRQPVWKTMNDTAIRPYSSHFHKNNMISVLLSTV